MKKIFQNQVEKGREKRQKQKDKRNNLGMREREERERHRQTKNTDKSGAKREIQRRIETEKQKER